MKMKARYIFLLTCLLLSVSTWAQPFTVIYVPEEVPVFDGETAKVLERYRVKFEYAHMDRVYRNFTTYQQLDSMHHINVMQDVHHRLKNNTSWQDFRKKLMQPLTAQIENGVKMTYEFYDIGLIRQLTIESRAGKKTNKYIRKYTRSGKIKSRKQRKALEKKGIAH